ncbi:MAG: type II toxin-antitoxin system HicA family toxin [Desulfobulbus sp.]|nr:type II toxin-antitoxin system HicA family toxin [Desulfobulbus sp.]
MNAKQLMDILKKNGWKLDRINGSHHIFVKEGCRSVAVPLHGNRDIGNFARRILKEAGIE